MRHLISNIGTLYSVRQETPVPLRKADMANMPQLNNAWLLIENGLIHSYGSMELHPESADKYTDAKGKCILPTYCDSHTHIVFAAFRSEEFVMKIKGMKYEEIAAAGGGILNSAAKLRACSEDSLFESALERLEAMKNMGTAAVEIKSGYGLNTDSELKMLRVIRRLKEKAGIPIKATFLGAHAFPAEYKNNSKDYLGLLIDEMLPRIQADGLADYIDVFCEKGFFSNDDSTRILEAGMKAGLKAKIHVNQLSNSGGVQMGVKQSALTVDHLEEIAEEEIRCLSSSQTIATLLPSCSFFLRIPYAPARQLVDCNVAVALASDYNPGSTPSGNMNFVLSLACIQQRLLPEEAFHAASINGAFAMEVQDECGSISPGKRANLIMLKKDCHLSRIPYSFGEPPIEKVFINGI